MITINKKEWKFVAIICLITIFFAFMPMIIGWMSTSRGNVFLFINSQMNRQDYPFHFSYIEQVKAGHFLFENLFTSENHQVLLFNPFWLAVGMFAKIFHLSTPVAFHLSRFFLTPILLIIAYYLTALFFEYPGKRKICFIILIFSSGILGFLGRSDIFIFSAIYNFPHFIASLSFLILIFLFSIFAFEKYKLKYSLWAGFFALLLFSFHPYHIYTIFGVLLAFLIVDIVKNRKINIDYIKHYCIIILFSLPPVLYYLWQLKYNEVFYQWSLQNITLTPNLLIVLSNYILLIPLSLMGIYSILKSKNISTRETFLITWLFTQFFLIYLPIKTNSRLMAGLVLPIVILATYGLFYLENFLKEKNWIYQSMIGGYRGSILFLASSIFLFSFVNILTLSNDLVSYYNNDSNTYISKTQVMAMNWMKNNTAPESVVFASLGSGGLIPYLSLRKVFIGHLHGTIHYAEKYLQRYYFVKEKDINRRVIFLKENKINYLYFGPEEKKEFMFNPDSDIFLEKVYNNEAVSIYRVK